MHELAELNRVATGYWAADGQWSDASEDTLVKILAAMGVHLCEPSRQPTEADVVAAIERHHDRQFTRPLPPCVVARHNTRAVFEVHVHDGSPAEVTISLEDGGTAQVTQVDNFVPPRTVDGQAWGEASFALPADLPLGWHTLRLESDGISDTCSLIITPQRLTTGDRYAADPVSGIMAQLYSVRSSQSWAMGDFNDLGLLSEVAAAHAGAEFVLVNPLHAAEPFPPVEDSPYLPTSRRFVNPIYIRPQDTAEYALADAATRQRVDELAAACQTGDSTAAIIERNPVYAAKLEALRLLFAVDNSRDRLAAFDAYCDREGGELDAFAHWCAMEELKYRRTGHAVAGVDGKAPAETDIDDSAPAMVATKTFYKWLQFICDEQLSAAHQRAEKAGMSIGLMADLAVGVHPGGASASTLGDVLAADASVGAPPDGYNSKGQDWSQPPWHPVKLAEAGYHPWRDMLRTVFRSAGGIRVDHILGLFRLWWIPRMQSPLTGTYVHYDHEAMVGILALEAQRAGAVVIGEDLGTFEPWVQDYLSDRGIMGTSVLWFESEADGSGAKHQSNYRTMALTSVTTHDLPPTAGLLQGEHVQLRERLGLLNRPVEEEDREDTAWQNSILSRVAEAGCFSGTPLEGHCFDGAGRDDRGDIADLLVGVHRFAAGTPSALVCTGLVDMVGDTRTQNQPGTTREDYPNWCIPLCDGDGHPVLIEDLPHHPLFARIARAHTRPNS
nr:4-alpha-glucanotransferase [Corynebacterium mendelii]